MIVPLKMIGFLHDATSCDPTAAKVKIVPRAASRQVSCPKAQLRASYGDATERPPVLRETIEGGV